MGENCRGCSVLWAGGLSPAGFAHGSCGCLSPAPQKASEGQDPELDGGQEAEDPGDTHHVNARCPLYPNSTVVRFPVPNEKVPWEVSACPGRVPTRPGWLVVWGPCCPMWLGTGAASPLQAHRVTWDR